MFFREIKIKSRNRCNFHEFFKKLLYNISVFVYISALVVRRTTLTTLIHLLQEDYLKMTAGFFFRILQTMCDEVDEIKVLDFSYFFGNVNVLFENLDPFLKRY